MFLQACVIQSVDRVGVGVSAFPPTRYYTIRPPSWRYACYWNASLLNYYILQYQKLQLHRLHTKPPHQRLRQHLYQILTLYLWEH